ncbi:MAG: hypothetical protein HYV23_07715 [Deltaproteobacteria bacterium]|nr:hypothetical protein [Deltaproteobacteria bacterium]
MRQIVRKISAAALVSVLMVATYRVYDSTGKLTEIWKDRGEVIDIYSPSLSRKGFIKKERNQWGRYDKEWKKEATIEREDGQDIELDK